MDTEFITTSLIKTKALNTPIETIRDNKCIEIDYFVCWVNSDWTKSWVGDHESVLYRQSNSVETYEALASDACSHFADDRYFKVNGKPVFTFMILEHWTL